MKGMQSGTTAHMDPLRAAQCITDEYSARILLATFKNSMSVMDISREYNIPPAACYRRISELEDVGLVECTERVLTERGKTVRVYVSQLKNAYIFFEGGKLRVRFHLYGGLIRDFGGDWSRDDIRTRHTPGLTIEKPESINGHADSLSETPDSGISSESPTQPEEREPMSVEEENLVEETLLALERVVSVSRSAIQDIRDAAGNTQRPNRTKEAVLAAAERVADVTVEAASRTEKPSGSRGEK